MNLNTNVPKNSQRMDKINKIPNTSVINAKTIQVTKRTKISFLNNTSNLYLSVFIRLSSSEQKTMILRSAMDLI